MRASSQDAVASQLMGVKVSSVLSATWIIATVLGGVAGIMSAPFVFLDTHMMFDAIIMSFAGAVLGGFITLPGAVLGGFLMGIFSNLISYCISPGIKIVYTFLIVLVFQMTLNSYGSQKTRMQWWATRARIMTAAVVTTGEKNDGKQLHLVAKAGLSMILTLPLSGAIPAIKGLIRVTYRDIYIKNQHVVLSLLVVFQIHNLFFETSEMLKKASNIILIQGSRQHFNIKTLAGPLNRLLTENRSPVHMNHLSHHISGIARC
ncbi:branched-chain amino acid ABC transporter permease [Paenibacillus sedimenti]|uniref:Branched-chain amino acid ABC transporter permease n=1 Tax=Paenibacillus sedimenti TaxID=2770274 RepID=A0A926KTQ5_9BACL|nr:branched-chain amino acid ABC transporter permease [Paenibacillus sedimenti]MBD0383850.1 branched-chain amino acid ABC transporter permease [Paenibacillus sedimenti]